jgi:hypothetical protein
MADGYLGKCKNCAKADVVENRNKKLEYYRQYDRDRANDPERVEGRKAYASTSAGKEVHARALKKSAEKYPEKNAARVALGNAVRDGRVTRKPCRVCGNKKSQGHHHDYSKPFDVIWLCTKHHAEEHKRMRAAKADVAA